MPAPHRLLALFGLAAILVPAGLSALDLTEFRVHSDLWFAAAPLLVAVLVPAGKKWPLLIAGGLCLAVVGINLPTVWGNAFGGEEGAVAEHLRTHSRLHLACYGAVFVAGAGIALSGRGARS